MQSSLELFYFQFYLQPTWVLQLRKTQTGGNLQYPQTWRRLPLGFGKLNVAIIPEVYLV